MKNRKALIAFDILSLIGALVVNYLSVNLPLNGLTPQQISDRFNIYFVPAGYAFSIWGVIYLGLIAFVIFRALPKQQDNVWLNKIDSWFILSNFANAMWLICFHYQRFILALGFMALLLVSLINVFEKLQIGRKKITTAWKWAVEIPFSIYLGWISVATIANVSQVLDYVGWSGFGIPEEIWFLIMAIVVVAISALMSFTRKNYVYPIVLVWALVAIAVKFPDVRLVNYTAWGSAIAITLIDMVTLALPSKRNDRSA